MQKGREQLGCGERCGRLQRGGSRLIKTFKTGLRTHMNKMRQEHSGKTFRNDGSLKAGCHAKLKKKKSLSRPEAILHHHLYHWHPELMQTHIRENKAVYLCKKKSNMCNK